LHKPSRTHRAHRAVSSRTFSLICVLTYLISRYASTPCFRLFRLPLRSLPTGLFFAGNQGQPDSNQSTVLNSDEQTEAAPLDLDKPQAKANAQASVAFGKPSALEMPALTQLCQNPYGCLQERLFPLGWSADNKFAFLLERTNEAVSNYTLDAYILDARTNTVLDSLSFVAREQADYSEAADQFDFNIVWGLQEKALRKLVAEHRIDFGSGIKLSALAALDLTINAEG
jgi:hypothetical protein